jgi:hypothetical protein
VKPNPKALLVNVGDFLEVWNLFRKLCRSNIFLQDDVFSS